MTASRKRSSAASNTVKLAQMGVAVPSVVAHRLTRMALAGPVLSARDRREFTNMVQEKQVAFTQSWMGMATEMWRLQQQWWSAWFGGGLMAMLPSMARSFDNVAARGLAPVHRKAVGNARRLSRTRLR